MVKLGVNIDHVATVRNARGEIYPNPYEAALIAKKSGANSVTIHLREDRRHISDKDLFNIRRIKNLRLNLEIAPTNEMLKIALKAKPDFVCIVPEKRKEITTEGGLNLFNNFIKLKKIIISLKRKNIRTSLFIEPKVKDVKIAKELNTDSIEIHTGKFCKLVNARKNYYDELQKIKIATRLGNILHLEVHAGHGLTYKSTKIIKKIKGIKELNIGHFIISESIFYGLRDVILKFRRIIK